MEEWLARLIPRLPDRQRTRVLLLGVVMGVVGGVSAGGFDLALVLVGRVALGTGEPAITVLAPARVLAATAVTALLAGLVGVLGTRRGRPQGIADVIAAVRTRSYPLEAREGLTSAVASALAVGGGQSAGREGPTAQLAASLAATLCDRLQVPRTTARYLVAAAAGAGIAASFNSPLGGAFFAMENLLGDFALEAFAPVVVASVVGTVIGQAMLGDRLAVALPAMDIGHPIELVAYPVLGIACGLVAIAFRATTRVAAGQLERIPGPRWLRPLVPGLLVGVLGAVGLNEVMGNGYGFVQEMIRAESAPIGFLVVVVAAKVVASAFAVASKSGGMFAATMFLGAVTGELVGAATQALVPGALPHRAALAAVGMGGVAAAVAHTPITMTLMMFEMTGNYAIVLPLMVTIAIATVMAQATDPTSAYVENLLERGLKLDHGREELVVHDLRVRDVMRSQVSTIEADAPLAALIDRFLGQRADEVFVVRGSTLVGLVDIQDIKGLLANPAAARTGTVAALARPSGTLSLDDSLAVAMERFVRDRSEVLPVVDPEGQLLGAVAERELVAALNREILRQDALMARIEHGPADQRATDLVELPDGFSVEVVSAAGAAGKTLLELALPRNESVTVLAVDEWDEVTHQHVRRAPGPTRPLGPHDRLVLVGPTDRLTRLAVSIGSTLG